MLSPLPLVLAILFHDVLASPHPPVISGQSISLLKRSPVARTPEQWGDWAKAHRDMLQSKYGGDSGPQKRGAGTNLMTNQKADSSYYGSIAIGSPATSYQVILDTGSSDLWVAGNGCATCGKGIALFNKDASSSFKPANSRFSITYGSGKAAGVLGQDKVQMAGFSVDNQTFAICDTVSTGLLNKPVSGLMGLGFDSIASSRAKPFWQILAERKVWDEPLMTFQFTRFVNNSAVLPDEPGGTFTMGFTNKSLYVGDIDYQPLVGKPSYWLLPLKSMSVLGNNLTLPLGPDSFAAIDTGTTLVGGPGEAIAQIYSQIPGSIPGTDKLKGYYTYPCAVEVNVTMNFGGKSWAISPDDFRLTRLSPASSQCLGAFFELQTGSSAPNWIVGDTFLKNVYSVYRFNPPSVGFAELSAVSKNFNDQPVPSPTIGNPSGVVSPTTGGSRDRKVNGERQALDVSRSTGAIGIMAMIWVYYLT